MYHFHDDRIDSLVRYTYKHWFRDLSVCVCVYNIFYMSHDAVLKQLSTDGAQREMAEIPDFRQNEGEEEEDFMQRVDSTTMMTISESQIEDTFKVNNTLD